jgi:hypothetical protein
MVRLYCEHRDEETVESVLNAAEERLRSFAHRFGGKTGEEAPH